MLQFRLFDYLIAVAAALVIAASVLWSASGTPQTIEIEASGVSYILPPDGTLEFEGPVGLTRVEAVSGVVSVTHSDCRDKLCVAMSPVSSGWLACLPNRVFVSVSGSGRTEAEVDSVTF